jgi:hypothetical protein
MQQRDQQDLAGDVVDRLVEEKNVAFEHPGALGVSVDSPRRAWQIVDSLPFCGLAL